MTNELTRKAGMAQLAAKVEDQVRGKAEAEMEAQAELEAAPIGLEPRQLAWRVVLRVAAGAYADAALEGELARAPHLNSLDRALATELAYGTIRRRRLLDAWIDALGRLPASRQPPKLRALLELGLYQLLFSDRVPPSAAVSTTVELAKRGGLARLAPVVNGLLRSAQRRRATTQSAAAQPAAESDPLQGLELPAALQADPAARLGLRHSLPDWLAQLLLQWLPPEQAERVALACNTPPSLDLRVNRRRCSREQLLDALAAAGIAAEPLADLPEGITLPGRSGDLRQLPGYGEGHWCVQDRNAQRIALLLDPRPGERLLDACAAPGGKSTHLAELIDDQGEIWAVDRAEARLQRLQRNAGRLGLSCIHTLAADATTLAEQRPDWIGTFDRILLDAPCSGLGTLARHADARWRMTPEAIDELVALQRRLLNGLAPLLKPGGVLVYATCTVHPAENEERIAAFLAEHPGWQCQERWQRWPAPGAGDGFFAARLEAPAQTPPPQAPTG